MDGDGTGGGNGGSLLLVVGGVFVVLGLGIAVGASVSAVSAIQAADSGVETEGTVVSTSIEEALEESGSGGDDSQDTERVYYAQVTYNYTVDGETYTSSALKVPPLRTEPGGKEFDTRGGAEAYLSQYEPGDPLTVFYMSDDHSESFREKPGYSPVELALPFVFGLPFAVVGIGIILYGRGVIGTESGKGGADETWTAEDDRALEEETAGEKPQESADAGAYETYEDGATDPADGDDREP